MSLPGDLADVLPHETANAWLRTRLDKAAALVPKLWLETPDQFAKRLAGCVEEINNDLADGLDSLCRSFPKRLQDLKRAKGDRLRH